MLMIRHLISTACCLAAFLAPSAGGAELAIESIEFGFGGLYKAGEWTPLTISLVGDAPAERVIVETATVDAEGSTVIRRSRGAVVGDKSSRSTIQTVIQSGRLGSDLTIRLLGSDGEVVAERLFRAESEGLPNALPNGATFWVAAGELEPPESNEGGVSFWPAGVVAAQQGDALPADALAYRAVDLLILRGDLRLSDEQSEVIRQWVLGGGNVAIALGRHTGDFESGPLANWLPITSEGTVQLRELERIEAYSNSKRRLPAYARVQIARLSGGTELLASGDGALIARAPFGFGTVTVFAFDLDAPPFSTWVGLSSVVERALLPSEGGGSRRRPLSVPGVTDMATQLIRAEEQFPGLNRTTVGSALLLLLLYALLIGPLDYVLVHRILKRPALTWITLPLFVAFAVWSFHSAARTANGSASLLSEIELLDLDVETKTLRGKSVVTLYSAESVEGTVEISPALLGEREGELPPAHLKWFSPPEATFGGTFRDASGSLFRPEYLIPEAGTTALAKRVPMLVSSSRRFEAEWQTNNVGPVIESSLSSFGRGRLQGTIDHTLPGPIKNFVVVYENSIIIPREPEWYAGEPIDVDSGRFIRRDLTSVLTGQESSVVQKGKGAADTDYILKETAYDPQSTDLGSILLTLTFHEATGGTRYTGLTNSVLDADDFSSMLSLGRAVVFGEIELPNENVAAVSRNEATFERARRSTFVRFLIPVEKRGSPTDLNLAPTDVSAATDAPRPPSSERYE